MCFICEWLFNASEILPCGIWNNSALFEGKQIWDEDAVCKNWSSAEIRLKFAGLAVLFLATHKRSPVSHS